MANREHLIFKYYHKRSYTYSFDFPSCSQPPRPPARVLMNAGSGWVELPAAPPRKPDRSALARMLEIAKEARSLGGGMVFVPG